MSRVSSISFLIAAALCVCPPGISTAFGQGPRISVERRSEPVIEAIPGELVRAVFVLTNRTGTTVDVQAHASLPAGWQWLAPPPEGDLERGASTIHVVAFRIPAEAPPGRHTVRYDISSGGSTRMQAGDSVVIAVAERHELSLSPVEAPRFVPAGSRFETRFLLRSRGNIATTARLHVSGNSRLRAHLDSSIVVLEPGEARIVTISVDTDASLPQTLRQILRLHAESARDTAVATSVVEIIPRGGVGEDPRRGFPVQLALRTSEPSGSVAAVELSGSGALTKDGATRLSFLLRGPETQRTPLFGERDEYRLDLHAPNFALMAGDRYFKPDLLTQQGRYGFGVGGTYNWSGVEIGGLTVHDRRAGFYAPWTGGFLGFRSGGSSVRLHYDRFAGDVAQGLWTGRAVLALSRELSVEAEYGNGDPALADDRPEAHAFRVRAVYPRVAVDARLTRADAGFPGRNQGLLDDYAGISLRPWGELQVFASMNRSENAIGTTSTRGSHTHQMSVGHGSRASVQLRSHRRFTDIPYFGYDLEDRSIRLRLGHRIMRAWIWPEAEFGQTQDRIAGGTTPFHRYALRMGVHTPTISATTWVERFDGRTEYVPISRPWVSAGMNTSVRIWAETRLQVSVNGRRYDHTGRWSGAVVDLGFVQGLPFGHRLTTRARSVAYDSDWTNARNEGFLEYAMPFEVPIHRGEGGWVRGRVFDAETGEPQSGVPVRLGERTALSDDKGRVEFRGVPPGTHYLTIDQLTAGIDRVAIEEMPMPVHVVGGKPAEVEVGLVRGARLSGTVRHLILGDAIRMDAPRETVENGGLARVVVVATRGDLTHRRVTDSKGNFDFGHVQPGRWTLTVGPADLPPHSDPESARASVELVPGGEAQVSLRVGPRRREVRIVDRGEVRVDGVTREMAPAEKAAPIATESVRQYVVGLDDVGIMQIARNVYDDVTLWPKIWVANRAQVPDPDLIRVGQILDIPPKSKLTFTEERARDAYYEGRAGSPRRYTVGKGDFSLMQVARNVYGDARLWPKIWVANRATLPDPDIIKPGQVLHIPARAPLTEQERKALEEYRDRNR